MERDRFDRLLLQHLPAAQRFAIRLTGDPQSAEDLLQDAIVRAVNGSERFEGKSTFTTWLFQIIVNRFRDGLRKKPTEPIDGDLTDARIPEPSSGMNEQEIGRIVAKRVSALPPRQREAMVLVVYENMSVCDVAQILGISDLAVRVNLSHARAKLREELAGYL